MTETTPPIHRHKKKPFDWEILAVIVPLTLAILGWGASIEVRMSKHESALELSQRVKNIEDLMLPMLSDWKAKRELDKLKKELGMPTDTAFSLSVTPDETKPEPKTTGKSKPKAKFSMNGPQKTIKLDEIENNAKNWAASQIEQSAPLKTEK